MSTESSEEHPQRRIKRCEDEDGNSPVILVIGSIGLDKLIGVEKYPDPDTKVRTTWYKENGGGNAANTAAAIGKLSDARIFENSKIRVKFLGKVGCDDVGDKLYQELKDSNVDVSSPLLLRGPEKSTTSFCTIVVSETEHTRTCLFTPGTCGELTLGDVKALKDAGQMNEVFKNVIHVHSDSRHTEAALKLAKEAKARGIPVSVDCEKDRSSQALDELLELCDILFTNSGCLEAQMQRLTLEKEREHGRSPIPYLSAKLELGNPTIKKSTIDTIASSLTPSTYYARWGLPMKSDVIVTQGSMGVLHFREPVVNTERLREPMQPQNEVSIRVSSGTQEIENAWQVIHDGELNISIRQHIIHAGVLRDVDIVDTTGCGDTFVGAFLLSRYSMESLFHGESGLSESIRVRQFTLAFASFVAGKKTEGPGARTAQPTGQDIDSILGVDFESAAKSLNGLITQFNEK